MGWNTVRWDEHDLLFKGLEGGATFYFLHSFFVSPAQQNAAIAHAHYGERFVCAIRKNNVMGVQFHPEKSHDAGEKLLLNFARL
jgi:glutamine amidotransferase